MTYNYSMNNEKLPQTIVELSPYIRTINAMWDEDTQAEFKNYIAYNPLAGDVIPGTGGIRKIRWQSSGHGKRGGTRVIYYVYNENNPIYLLTAYNKNVQKDMSSKEKKLLANLVAVLKSHLKE